MFCFLRAANLKRDGVGCSFLVVFYLKIAFLLRGVKKAVEHVVFNGFSINLRGFFQTAQVWILLFRPFVFRIGRVC